MNQTVDDHTRHKDLAYRIQDLQEIARNCRVEEVNRHLLDQSLTIIKNVIIHINTFGHLSNWFMVENRLEDIEDLLRQINCLSMIE